MARPATAPAEASPAAVAPGAVTSRTRPGSLLSLATAASAGLFASCVAAAAAPGQPRLLPPSVVLGAAGSDSAGAPAPPPERRSWRDALPLMKEEALSRGYELPYPFGAGAVYTYIDRLIEVTDVRIGVNGGVPQSVSSYLELGSRSYVHNVNAKFDVFVLPFLNVYGIFGYIKNFSTSHAYVTVPRPPPLTGSWSFETSIPTELEGVVGGGGITLAAGYDDFFLTADAILAQSDIGFADWLRAGVVSVRSGWNGKIGPRPTQLWAGGTLGHADHGARNHGGPLGGPDPVRGGPGSAPRRQLESRRQRVARQVVAGDCGLRIRLQRRSHSHARRRVPFSMTGPPGELGRKP